MTLFLSMWGATLSTLLAILTLLDRTRARPIIRAHAKIQFRNVRGEPKFVCRTFKTGRYDDTETQEIFAEFRVENHGTRPLSLQHIYVEEEKGNLNYITPDGLPIVLEGQSSAKFEIQKEYFDAIDFSSKERIIANVIEIGFVDALDRRYRVGKKETNLLLCESLFLPTTRALFRRKEHPEDVVSAFQTVHKAILTRRSQKEPPLSWRFPSGLNKILKFWAREG
jgi:hypothetical protein